MVPLMFVGFICNLLINVVLGSDKTMNKTTRFLLQTLALADIIFNVLRPICDIMELYALYRPKRDNLNIKIYITIGLIMTANQTIVAWMAVIVTYQRYVAVSRPLHARQYIRTSRARAAVVVVWIASFIIYIPFIYVGLASIKRVHSVVYLCFYRILFFTVAFVLPIPLTVILNKRLIVVTRRTSAFLRQQFAPGERNDNRIACNNRVTVTLIVIVTVYLICELPMTTVQIVQMIAHAIIDSFSCEYHRINNYILIAYNISLCFIVINS
jgi:hypothetical protein